MIYVAMLAAGLLMGYAHRRYRGTGESWCRPLAGASGMLALLLALTKIICDLTGGARGPDLGPFLAWQAVGAHGLGAYVAEHDLGRRVLIISAWSDERKLTRRLRNGFEEAFVAGLDGAAEIAATVFPEAPVEGAAEPMFEMMSAAQFDAIIAAHPECDVVLVTASMPMALAEIAFWQRPEAGRPRLLLAYQPPYEYRRAIEAGLVTAMLVPSASPTIAEWPPDDQEIAFAQRYQIVDRNNLAAVVAAQPCLFPAGPP